MQGIHFEIKPGEEALYFVKAKGFSTQMPLTISSSKSLIKKNIEHKLAYGLFFGLALMMIVHNLFNYLRLREIVYLYYVFHVGFHFVFKFIGFGFGKYDLELLKIITKSVSIPVIASGGAGNLQHLYEAIKTGGASAVLAASIFHYGEFTIKDTKEYLKSKNVPVRL